MQGGREAAGGLTTLSLACLRIFKQGQVTLFTFSDQIGSYAC